MPQTSTLTRGWMSKSLSWICAGLGFLVRMGLVGLRKRSRITTVAQAAANSTNFFQRIREELPTLPSRTLRAEQGVSVSPPANIESDAIDD